ncbi:MAG: hypothetical protein AAFY56_00900 [Pseudomonadota bacterium]
MNRGDRPSLRFSLFVIGFVACAAVIDRAAAGELVVGGYSTSGNQDFTSTFDSPDLGSFRASERSEPGSLSFNFTPRQSGSLLGSIVQRLPATRFVVGTGSANPVDAEDDFFDVGMTANTSQERRFSIGGALEFESVRVLGGYSRVDLMGQPSSVVSAGIDYGRLSTQLAYGQSDETTEDTSSDVVMFSTDLSALSWLTLESDVAFGNDDEDQSVAAGRIGLRLDF